MKIHFFATLLALFLTCQTFAGNFKGGKDAFEISYIKDNKSKPDKAYQQQLRKSAPWQKFIKSHSNWSVEFNEATQYPHRAYGKPIPVSASDPTSAAMSFIENNLGEWKLPLQDLKFQSQNFSGKYHNVFYTQTYQGLDVINSRVFIKLTKTFNVNTWGLDVFTIDISTTPSLSKADAIEKGKAGIATPITDVSKPVLKILPVADGHSIVIHLVYEFVVSTKNEENIPAKYSTLIDANTGEILYRHNNVMFFQPLNSDVNVEATVFTKNPYVPSVVVPLRNLRVNVGGTIYHTDSLGNVPISGANPINADFSLEGLWSKTVTDMDTISPIINSVLPAGSDTVNFDAVTSIRHTSGYYHVNIVHDFMKSYFPSFTGLDFPLPTRIDVTGGSCNAFYTGDDINFFETGGGCNCMSQIADVVYHEYGHGINDLFYQSMGSSFQNSGMNEGYADVWAISLTQDPILGAGNDISSPTAYIRRYDINRKVYPQDITGDPHDVGEIIAGAWYDVSLNINSWDDMTTLYASTFFDLVTGPDGDEGQLFSDILLAALTEDDDDADLSNGSPNDTAILDAFALHGIFLINNVTVDHNQLLSAASTSAIPVTVTMTSQFPWLTPTVKLHYRTDNTSPYTVLPMTLVSGNDYSATIPQQTAGTIISYYVEVIDFSSTPIETLPVEADSTDSNIPYFIIVDCVRALIDDFDANQSIGWQAGITGDNATGGQWIIAQPLASFKTGDTCQTGEQHTLGGMQCGVTGNATSTSSPNYSADVDGGKTTLQSPTFSLSGINEPIISYWRWYSNDQGSAPRADYWQTFISSDGVNFIPVEYKDVPDHSWRRFAFKAFDYISPSSTSITLKFEAEDANIGSVIEAAVDDIEIYSNIINIGISSPDAVFNISVFPNPANTSITVGLDLAKSEKIDLEIVNNLGQSVLTSVTEMNAGRNTANLDIQHLDNGVYYLRVKNGKDKMEKVFSVLR